MADDRKIAPAATKTAAPVPAKPAAAKPVKQEAKRVDPVAPKAPVEAPEPVTAAAPIPQQTEIAATAAEPVKEAKTMQETIKKTAEEATQRASAMFGDLNTRAKDAVAKGNKFVEEMNELAKGNVEAVVASSKIAAKGAEDIARYSADYGRKTVEQATENAKKFAAVKSPTEFFQLQTEIAKGAVEAMVAESSKFTENYLKLLGEIAQPISNRVAVTVEKVKLAA